MNFFLLALALFAGESPTQEARLALPYPTDMSTPTSPRMYKAEEGKYVWGACGIALIGVVPLDALVEETKGDDIRLEYDAWDIWKEDFR